MYVPVYCCRFEGNKFEVLSFIIICFPGKRIDQCMFILGVPNYGKR